MLWLRCGQTLRHGLVLLLGRRLALRDRRRVLRQRNSLLMLRGGLVLCRESRLVHLTWAGGRGCRGCGATTIDRGTQFAILSG